MKQVQIGRIRANAIHAATVLAVASVANASVIDFVVEDFSTSASMFAEAGGFQSQIVLPTQSLTPTEDYGIGSSHSQNDGIGQSTSAVSQTYALLEVDGMPAFSLVTHAAGAFSSLNPFPFTGTVTSRMETTIAFEVTENVTVRLEGVVGWASDSLPGDGSVSLISEIELIAIDDVGTSLICQWSSPEDLVECFADLQVGQRYRLNFLAEAHGEYNAVIDATYEFVTDSDFLFVVLEPDPPSEPSCQLAIVGMPEAGECFNPGDEVTIFATVMDGTEPYDFTWFFDPESDWAITAGQGTDTVTLLVGTDTQAHLHLLVGDTAEQFGECDIILCSTGVEPTEPECQLAIVSRGVSDCIEQGETIAIMASVSGGEGPYEFTWFFDPPSDWTIESGQGTDTVVVMAGSDATADLQLMVEDQLEQIGECGITLCLEGTTTEPTCELSIGVPRGDDCIEEGEFIAVTATVSGGVPPYELDWFFDPPSDWTIESGQGTDTVIVRASSDATAELHLLVTDHDEQSSQCSITLCLEGRPPEELVCELSEQETCIESPGDTLIVSALVSGGVQPYTLNWQITDGDWHIIEQFDSAVKVQAGESMTATLRLHVVDDAGEETECTVSLGFVACEGCTPGFWRQPHHYGHWTPPYEPKQPFSDVFDNAYPGMTLSDVVALSGGGLNALGRHTVAALLNAASPNVGYPLTVQEVIDKFNAAFSSGNRNLIESQKDEFESYNELGCPLGNRADFNGDGRVDMADLLMLLDNWSSTGHFDISGSGTVGIDDLLILLSEWGAVR